MFPAKSIGPQSNGSFDNSLHRLTSDEAGCVCECQMKCLYSRPGSFLGKMNQDPLVFSFEKVLPPKHLPCRGVGGGGAFVT